MFFQQSFTDGPKAVGRFGNRRSKQADLFAGLGDKPEPAREPLPGQASLFADEPTTGQSSTLGGDPAPSLTPASGGPRPIKAVEAAMADRINRQLGTTIEVTSRAEDKWTISGPHNDASAAAAWLVKAGLMRVESSAVDDELNETFYYLESGPRALPAPAPMLALPKPEREPLPSWNPTTAKECRAAIKMLEAYQSDMRQSRSILGASSCFTKGNLHKNRCKIARLRARLRKLSAQT